MSYCQLGEKPRIKYKFAGGIEKNYKSKNEAKGRVFEANSSVS